MSAAQHTKRQRGAYSKSVIPKGLKGGLSCGVIRPCSYWLQRGKNNDTENLNPILVVDATVKGCYDLFKSLKRISIQQASPFNQNVENFKKHRGNWHVIY